MRSPHTDRAPDSWWWTRHGFVNAALVFVVLLVVLWTSVAPELSDEGVRLLSPGALVVVMVVVTAFARTLVGRNPKRHVRMFLGTIGGLAAGIWMGAPLSAWIGSDVSSLSAVGGVFVGWAVAYQFIKHIPRNAPTSQTA